MADRPILLSSPMVLALLAGRKTQTRRIISHIRTCAIPGSRPITLTGDDLATVFADASDFRRMDGNIWSWKSAPFSWQEGAAVTSWLAHIGYGVGDHLWVRESYWQRGHWIETPGLTKQGHVKWSFVPADDDIRFDRPDGEVRLGRHHRDPSTVAWHKRLARFMPRKYSRITLDVTDVRVERLQDISRGDAMEEGCPFPNMAKGPNPVDWYANLWNSINGAGAWASNPFVVAYTFRVTLSNIDHIGGAA